MFQIRQLFPPWPSKNFLCLLPYSLYDNNPFLSLRLSLEHAIHKFLSLPAKIKNWTCPGLSHHTSIPFHWLTGNKFSTCSGTHMLERKLQRCAANTRMGRFFINSDHFCSLIPDLLIHTFHRLFQLNEEGPPQTYILNTKGSNILWDCRNFKKWDLAHKRSALMVSFWR